MAITDPTIDPVTGLPVLDTSGIVQQIPLGRQIVDYTGWNATAQPTRGSLYPDDVIPVFANVQGQHPTTGNAQNVGTDGKNALLVKDVSGGGGAGTGPFTLFPYNLDQTTTGFGTHLLGAIGPATKAIRGIICAYSNTTNDTTASLYHSLVISVGALSSGNFRLCAISLNITPTKQVTKLAGEAHIMFPQGLFPFDPEVDGSGNMNVYSEETGTSPGNLTLCIWQDN